MGLLLVSVREIFLLMDNPKYWEIQAQANTVHPDDAAECSIYLSPTLFPIPATIF